MGCPGRLVRADQSGGLLAGLTLRSEPIVARALQVALQLLKLRRRGIPQLVGELMRQLRPLALQEHAEPIAPSNCRNRSAQTCSVR
jgi:hypothetical protein